MATKEQTNETIAAISTAEGEGGIAIIRISGKKSLNVLKTLFSRLTIDKKVQLETRKLYHGNIVNPANGEIVDKALCSYMKLPNSYTGEDVVEIYCHGGYLVPKKILELVVDQGVKPASPGEFTKRAFINGKMDLAQAEAVSNVISAQTELSLKQAEKQLSGELSKRIDSIKEKVLDIYAETESRIDFPEEDIDPLIKHELLRKTQNIITELEELINSYKTGKIIKEGIYTVIVGKPNVGKSSLLNQLLEQDRAIVSPIAGTTRDFIEEKINVNGIVLRLVDTAGIRSTDDNIEKIGVDLADTKIKEAEFVIIVIDRNSNLSSDDINILDKIKSKKPVVAVNKSDLEKKLDTKKLLKYVKRQNLVEISAISGSGVEQLKKLIYENILEDKNISDSSEFFLTDLRHKRAIEESLERLQSFIDLLNSDESPEFLSMDLRTSLDHLGEITGEVTTEDLLGKIFSKFCIGK